MGDISKRCTGCGVVFQGEGSLFEGTCRWRVCDRGNLWFNCKKCDSTLMIKKGKFDWYSPEKTMTDRAATLFNQLPNLKKLPNIPHVVMELQQLLRNENTTSSQLAAVSKNEPIVAANILSVANTMKQTGGSIEIKSLQHAISYIGLNSMADIVLTASVKSFPFATKKFNPDNFWQKSFLVGRIASKLTELLKPSGVIPDEAYIAGALCNLGKVVLAISMPNVADSITLYENKAKDPKSWSEGEKELKAYSHQVLGEIGSSFWGMPDYVTAVAGSHHEMPEDRTSLSFDDVIRFANQLSHWVCLEPTKMDTELLDALLKKVEMSEAELEKIVERDLLPLNSK